MKKDCNKNSHIFDYRIINQEKYLKKLQKSNINNFSLDCRFFNPKDTEKILKHFKNILEEKEKQPLRLTTNNNFFNGNIERGVYKKKK